MPLLNSHKSSLSGQRVSLWGSWPPKLFQKTSPSRGRCLTCHAQLALAGCRSAPASAPPVAPPNLCLLPAALPLLAATCPAVLRWLASQLKWYAAQTAAALSAEPECLAAPLASVGCMLLHPAKRINRWHDSVDRCFIGRSSIFTNNSHNDGAVLSATQGF